MTRSLASALLVLLLGAACARPADEGRGVGAAPTRESYAAEVARVCAPLAAAGSGADLRDGLARLRSVRDAVRALPTPPADGPEIDKRFLRPLDRLVATNEQAVGILDGDPSPAGKERALALLERGEQDLGAMQSFFADFEVPECGSR